MNSEDTESHHTCEEKADKTSQPLEQEDAANDEEREEPKLDESTPNINQHRTIFSANRFSSTCGMTNITIPADALEDATIHLTIAIRSAGVKAHDALMIAVDTLKRMDLVVVAEAVAQWIKAHRWKTAAIVIPLIL
ncbi:hypothetical protein IQ06DRAFT_347692 [Phaeosphaeriaceae sp. SRC1lsM3a]|nr:hypothetical protein IQ06DRAFT_347692 [Stagonospora sp. SRC1lsM3a]